MEKVKSLSTKRLIVEGKVNDKKAYFLLDTGASVGIIDEDQKKKYSLKEGKAFAGTLIGGGGTMRAAYMCNTPIAVGPRMISQFVMSDIENIKDSIKQQTGYEILGIIGLSQMKDASITLDLNDNLIIFE